MSDSLEQMERANLKEFLLKSFNRDELEDLVFDLSISHEMLATNTLSKFVRELIAYCERRRLVDCLLLEIARRRENAHNVLGKLIAKFQSCLPRKKVQIILDKNELEIPIGRLKQLIADACATVSADDIVIIAAAQGSIRLLIGVPETGVASLLTSSRKLSNSFEITSIIPFEKLNAFEQATWRSIIKKSSTQKSDKEPISLDQSWAEASRATANEYDSSKMKNILIADRNPDSLKVISNLVENNGFNVIQTNNPVDAKAILELQAVDLAIIDIQLLNENDSNDTSGMKLASEFIPGKPIPRIVMTAFPSTKLVRATLKPQSANHEIVDFLFKNDIEEELMQSIRRIERVNQWKLLESIADSFNETDLKTLFLSMGANYAYFAGNKKDKVREFMTYIEYVGKLPNLVEQLIDLRPSQKWVLV